ncbi:MAG: hypothetical protein DME55_09190 [Verrucomicrobia bacterium]|nr:MAG: hypothetical protein DME55_09190 [Verrucomicrobiota bacterium]
MLPSFWEKILTRLRRGIQETIYFCLHGASVPENAASWQATFQPTPIRSKFRELHQQKSVSRLNEPTGFAAARRAQLQPWIESMIGSQIVKIVSMDVYPCGDSCAKPVGTNIVKISEANYRDNPVLCMKIVVGALLSLPAGFYTIVYRTEPLPCVMDFCVGVEGFGLRVRPLDREAINNIKQPAWLRIEIE